MLEENLEVLHRVASDLLEKETLEGKELDKIILEIRPDMQLPDDEHEAVEEA